jgi:hypothetical protein
MATVMPRRLLQGLLPLACLLLPTLAQAELYLTIVQGLGGTPDYQRQFDEQREKITAAAKTLTSEDRVAVFHGDTATREALLTHFDQWNTRMDSSDRAAIYLVGHGSHDGYEYKFNLPGPDLTAEDIKQVLEALPGRNHFLVNTSSTSGAMLETITGVPAPRGNAAEAMTPAETDSRYILITATRSGNERNATHFGGFFADALTSEVADINKNNNISVQEAFDYAARQVELYFTESGRLATEHPVLRGEGAAQFSLSRLNELDLASEDPLLGELLQQRLALDAEIEELQLRRNELGNAQYLEQLQALILRSAELTERIDAERARSGNAP